VYIEFRLLFCFNPIRFALGRFVWVFKKMLFLVNALF